jgi:hypothetical protein
MGIIGKKTRLKKKHERKKSEHFCALDDLCCHEWRLGQLVVRLLGFVQSCGDDKFGGKVYPMGFFKGKNFPMK